MIYQPPFEDLFNTALSLSSPYNTAQKRPVSTSNETSSTAEPIPVLRRQPTAARFHINDLRHHPLIVNAMRFHWMLLCEDTAATRCQRADLMAALTRWYVAAVPGIEHAHAETMAAIECNGARRRALNADLFFDKLFRLAHNWCHTLEPGEYNRFLSLLFHRVAVADVDNMRFHWRPMEKIAALAEDDHLGAHVDLLPFRAVVAVSPRKPDVESDAVSAESQPYRPHEQLVRNLRLTRSTPLTMATKTTKPFEIVTQKPAGHGRRSDAKKRETEPGRKGPKARELTMMVPAAAVATDTKLTKHSERLRLRIRKTTLTESGSVKPLLINAEMKRMLVAEAMRSINWSGVLGSTKQSSDSTTVSHGKAKTVRGKTTKKGRRKVSEKAGGLRKATKAAAEDPPVLIEQTTAIWNRCHRLAGAQCISDNNAADKGRI